jgi:putative flippase GtrA
MAQGKFGGGAEPGGSSGPDDGVMSTSLLTFEPAGPLPAPPATVEIVVPVYNEEAGLELSIRRLHAYLVDRFPLTWTVTIADNASTDRTWALACRLAERLPGVRALHLDDKGRGRALRAAWLQSGSPVVAYMDVDLSTDLDALLPLVAPLVSGHSDVAIGTRLAPDARVVRGPKRELISRTYNLLLKATLRSGFSDAQCGFKAVRSDVARALLPLVEDEAWFFDTELLVLAERNGFRIHEVPVDWVDDPDSRVDLVGTATADLRGIGRMLRRILTGRARVATGAGGLPGPGVGADHPLPVDGELAAQLARFASIGVVSTVLFAALLALLVRPLGVVLADVVALGTCAVANTAANRRLTFSLSGRSGRARQYAASLVPAALPLALTLLAAAVLALLGVEALWARVLVLAAVSAVAAAARFVVLRRWVFRP